MAADAERAQQIDQILETTWQEFTQWREMVGSFQNLYVSEDIASVFIPKRLLELAEDPERVRVLQTESSPEAGGIIIYEKLSHPLSNPKLFESWVKEGENQKVRLIPRSEQEAPPGIDYMHCHCQAQIAQHQLDLDDKVYLHYLANRRPEFPSVCITRNLFDRQEMHRQGIGTSFYQRLEDILRKLGFKFLVGDIISPHPEFFQRDRMQLQSLPEDVRVQFPDFPKMHSNYMVKFL